MTGQAGYVREIMRFSVEKGPRVNHISFTNTLENFGGLNLGPMLWGPTTDTVKTHLVQIPRWCARRGTWQRSGVAAALRWGGDGRRGRCSWNPSPSPCSSWSRSCWAGCSQGPLPGPARLSIQSFKGTIQSFKGIDKSLPNSRRNSNVCKGMNQIFNYKKTSGRKSSGTVTTNEDNLFLVLTCGTVCLSVCVCLAICSAVPVDN